MSTDNDSPGLFDLTKGGLHIVMEGNPINGFDTYGPFKTASAAIEWGSDHCMQEWWPVPLLEPTK